MYVSLNADIGEQSDVFLVPQQALQRDTVGSYAMVMKPDGRVGRKDVEANNSYEGDWIVTGGLAAGDQVVVTGVQNVHEGSLAKATRWNGPDSGTRLSLLGAASTSRGRAAGDKS
jgi:membrane fusion protein (multidrug efflux system)